MSNFSVLNESSLHNTLKIYYASQTNGKTEVEMHGHIYDVFTEDGQVIEIQTKNLSKLSKKIKDTLEKGLKVTLVYPVPATTKIILTDEQGKFISSRKSPNKGSVYDIFKETTGLYNILLHKNFTLEVVFITMIEHRVRTEEPVQAKNNRRRFRKNWIKLNKKLEEIIEIKRFKTKKDYLSLLPPALPHQFCAKDIKERLKSEKLAPAKIYNNSNLILWVLNKMELLEYTETRNRSKYYKVK